MMFTTWKHIPYKNEHLFNFNLFTHIKENDGIFIIIFYLKIFIILFIKLNFYACSQP